MRQTSEFSYLLRLRRRVGPTNNKFEMALKKRRRNNNIIFIIYIVTTKTYILINLLSAIDIDSIYKIRK